MARATKLLFILLEWHFVEKRFSDFIFYERILALHLLLPLGCEAQQERHERALSQLHKPRSRHRSGFACSLLEAQLETLLEPLLRRTNTTTGLSTTLHE